MEQKLSELGRIMAEVADLSNAAAVLHWDQQVNMPPGGAAARGEQLATLSYLAHQIWVSPRVGQLLADLEAHTAGLDFESETASLVRVARRRYDQEVKVPADLVKALAKAASDGYAAWAKARAAADYEEFRPALAEILNLTIQVADAKGYDGCRYDALLDIYEPGMLTSQVDTLFAELRAVQVPLVKMAVQAQDRVDASVLYQHYDLDRQWQATLAALELIGFDLRRGRQDKSIHPFCTSFSSDDVRLTTKVVPGYIGTSLFGSLHEGGHGLYEQGIPARLRRTVLGNAASLGIHESQSRLWENIVGRSREFWTCFLPKLQELFPTQLADQSVESWYRAINRAMPSLIRIEADELTYNLHVMIRFELERALIDGQLTLPDLPGAWNDKYGEYLGVVPTNAAEGVLQDIHWSGGMFGYFPTYTLGNAISAHLYETAVSRHPDIPAALRAGETQILLGWMRQHIHQYGAGLTPVELLQKATGAGLTAQPYLRYLEKKFGELYA